MKKIDIYEPYVNFRCQKLCASMRKMAQSDWSRCSPNWLSNLLWCYLQIFDFFIWVYFAQEDHGIYLILHWISDSESCRRLIDLRYEILLFISHNYNVHRPYLPILSCGCQWRSQGGGEEGRPKNLCLWFTL
jgi:hypothetical protein